jgi:ribosomal protein S18 acetylase RimI-like enzyme
MHLDIKPASDYPTPDLVQYLNLGFEDYLVPIHFSPAQFLTMLRKDGIDLTASRVLLADDEPAGLALIARRGWTSRLAAMGISKAQRGKRLGSWFMEQIICDARERGDHAMVLEVIEQNEAAVRLYQKQGFEIIRRLIGFKHETRASASNGPQIKPLQEIDLREMGCLIVQYGMPDLPWQLSGETIALLNPPARAYQNSSAYIAVSDLTVEHVVIWSLLVDPDARGKGLAVQMLETMMTIHRGKTWHVPAIWPEEFSGVFEQAGFQREELSQWQMERDL